MTDKQVLLAYRLKQAEETLSDAEKMLEGGFSPRSVVNRAYYSMFYGVLALFLYDDVHVKTSKHAGIISTFDREFIHTGKIDSYYSKLLHKMFDIRQEGDYKELFVISKEEAYKHVNIAKEFVEKIKAFIREKEI
jgi:uncharacterized protein (UPF0332 family)